jgi:hypothetical protein
VTGSVARPSIQLSAAFLGCISSIVMPAAAASSVIRAGGSLLTVTPGFPSHTRAFPPASSAALARRVPSFVCTL